MTEKVEQEYYVLSLKYSIGKDDLVWWGPNGCGYYNSLDAAGRYTQAQIDKDKGLNNRDTTLAVPCEFVDGLAYRVVGETGRNKILEKFDVKWWDVVKAHRR